MKRIMVTVAVVGFALQGCGEQGDDAQTMRSALGAFGGWQHLTGGIVPEAPVLAVAPGMPLTAFGLGTDSQIWVTKQDANRHWNGVWRQLSNNGGPFTSRPGAAAFNVTSGSLRGHFAIVARRADNKYYITIRDQDGGGILLDWSVLPTTITYVGPPSLAFVPAGSATNPKAALIVLGPVDGGFVYFRNKLTNNGTVFSNSNQNWGAASLPTTALDPTGSAITYACPPTSASPSLIAAARLTDSSFVYSKFDGIQWSHWFNVVNGLFHDGPALATGCGEFSNETSIYGRGFDDAIWVSTQLSGGAQGFSRISTDVFAGLPTAVGETGFAHVAAVTTNQDAFSNSASSP